MIGLPQTEIGLVLTLMDLKFRLVCCLLLCRLGLSGVARGGGGGGHGPRAQALEGAPAQLVGANFKKKIRPRQISNFICSVLD